MLTSVPRKCSASEAENTDRAKERGSSGWAGASLAGEAVGGSASHAGPETSSGNLALSPCPAPTVWSQLRKTSPGAECHARPQKGQPASQGSEGVE